MELEKVVALRSNKKIYVSGDKLIKVFDETYSKSGILNEALNQARIEETGLNIPTLHEVTKIDGKWSIIMDYIEGKTLETLMIENPENMEEYLKIFVDTQMEIHSKKSKLLNVLNDKILRKIEDTDLSDAVKFDIHSKLAGFEKHDKVLHGDYQFSNVIIDRDNRVYVIDWAHATQGNASADVAMSYILLILGGKEDIAEKYLDLYCAKAKTDKYYVQKWIPIVAGAYLERCNEEQSKLLRKFIEVAEY